MIVKTKLSDNIHTIIINALETVRKTIDVILCCTSKNPFFQRIRNIIFTTSFNNVQTLKFKIQPTNGFFATVDQVYGGSFPLLTTAKRCFVACLHVIDNIYLK